MNFLRSLFRTKKADKTTWGFSKSHSKARSKDLDVSLKDLSELQDDGGSKFRVVEPSLGVGETTKRDSSSGKSFATSESVKETSTLEVDSLKGNTFVNQYLILKNLGKGAHGKVKLCLNTDDNTLYAVKIVNKRKLRSFGLRSRSKPRPGKSGSSSTASRDDRDDLKREIVVMKKMDHPNVVKLFEVIDDPRDDKMLMVMEYVNGGAVMEGCSNGLAMNPVSESMARQHFRDVLQGLEYMHYNNIIHRDLKPENLLLTAEGQAKISDFGSARYLLDGNDLMEDTCGTRPFFCPEMCAEDGRQYSGKKADIYALGVCLYMFVYGTVPFTDFDNVLDLFEAIRKKEVQYPAKDGVPISISLKDLLTRLLDKNPESRITLEETLDHPWVTKTGVLPGIKSSQNLHCIQVSEEEQTTALTPSIERVFDSLPQMTERIYHVGEFITQRGQPTDGLFLIKEGMCKVVDRELEAALDGEPSVDLDFATNAKEISSSESETEKDESLNIVPRLRRKIQNVRQQEITKIGNMEKRHVKKHVLKTTTRNFQQMDRLVKQSFNDRTVNVNGKKGSDQTVSRGPGSILGDLALYPELAIPLAKETIIAVKTMTVSFVAHEDLREYFTGEDSQLQVRLLLKKLQHVVLMRDTVEKFAVLNTEMEKIGHLRQVSKHRELRHLERQTTP